MNTPMLRTSERIIAAYFTYTALVSLAFPIRPDVRLTIWTVNVTVIAAMAFLALATGLRGRPYLRSLRDWYPLPMMLLAYREMGWLGALPRPGYEHTWIQWDRRLLFDFGLQRLIESLGPLLPSILEISYSLVYAISPFCMVWIYANRRYDRMEPFLVTFLTGIYLSYALFPYFPSEPPRTIFPNQDLPTILTPFRRFNLSLLGDYGIHLSVFPSAHCSGSLAAALGMKEVMPHQPYIWRTLLFLAISIAIATVYGRYHYAADAAAGIAIALLAWRAGRRVLRKG